MQTEESLLSLLRREPEQGMTVLIDEYSGLLWTVCRQYLSNTEDIKECVNETFSEFYLHIERFDPDKGSLKGYLAVIARRCAIRRYQENCRWGDAADAGGEQSADPFAHLEKQDELERALSALDPVDEQILRMKYYGGMTAREIADSLGLPYETVKKRHQRSLKKLLRTLSIGLVIAAILALLAACAYLVLRHFGFVPGYGVNTSADAAVYVLEEGTAVQGEDEYEFHLEDAYWRDGTFLANLMLYGESELAQEYIDVTLSGLDNAQLISMGHSGGAAHGTFPYRVIYEGELPDNTGDTLSLTLTIHGTPIPFTLQAAEESALDEVGFYTVTEEDGGLLAVPRIENGELVVSIHPLDDGDFCTYPFLNRGVWTGYGGPDLPITVTAPDGTVLEGEPASYSPFSGDTYLDWYFGPAEPGEYTLNVPYVYQYPAGNTEKQSVQVSLGSGESSAGASLSLPGGKLTLGRLFPIDSVTDYCQNKSDIYDQVGYHWWALEAVWEGEDPERVAAVVPVGAEHAGYTMVDEVSYHNTEADLWTQTVSEPGTEKPYTLVNGYVLGAMEGQDSVTISTRTEGMYYRWNHPFTIPMTVQPEPERESFAESADIYSLTATPRRVNGEVTVTLRPSSSQDSLIPSGNIVRSPLATMGAQDAPITLTAADGTVYEGGFQPGRTDDYSDWTFGDIPAGTYTLHVPYLYITDLQAYHMAVPLPQNEGESIPVGLLYMSFDSSIAMDTITGLGPDTGFPMDASSCAITHAFGGISATEQTPLASQLSLSPQSGKEDYTLVDVDLRLFYTEEDYFLGACERQYAFEESGPRLTCLLLRHLPGIYATDLTFANPVFRWNHAFDITVTIPE
ncbi:MAG TPA: sigma-70 family RNA polymerase sigma factor [Firmicutes bacterium]|nr:sigma-70 family RNA polymerase sigma factor [Bacillota bacterium]